MSHLDVLQCRLAELAALESSVRIAVRALYATYADLAHGQLDDEHFEVTTARILAELADDLLVALDDHRAHVASRLKKLRHPEQTAWPF